MNSKEIAEKYVYGMNDALTDSQEVKDAAKDIEDYAVNLIKAIKDLKHNLGCLNYGVNNMPVSISNSPNGKTTAILLNIPRETYLKLIEIL